MSGRQKKLRLNRQGMKQRIQEKKTSRTIAMQQVQWPTGPNQKKENVNAQDGKTLRKKMGWMDYLIIKKESMSLSLDLALNKVKYSKQCKLWPFNLTKIAVY